jgi:hypothetical protein
VASIGLAGNDINWRFNTNIPRSAEHVLEFVARDEARLFFPLTAAVDPKSAGDFFNDGRIVQVTLPGVHSDIGGSYANPYSYSALDMSYSFLEKLGVPLNPLTDVSKGYDYNVSNYDSNNFRLHDSSWPIDRLLHMWGIHTLRTKFVHPSPGY